MLRLILPAVVLAIVLSSSTNATDAVQEYDRFQLWNDCRPLGLIVEPLPEDATDIGLAEEAVTAAVHSRLRTGRLYGDDARQFLWISVNVVSLAFNINVGFYKAVRDEMSGVNLSAITWLASFTGMHGRDSSYILSSVTRKVDEFIDEYLRVNADAC